MSHSLSASQILSAVITKDVAADALALERGTQVEKPGWAKRFREMKLAKKAKK